MVHPAERPRFLNGENVVGFFDHTNGLAASRGSHAVQAWVGVGNVVTYRAFANLFLGLANRIGQRQSVLGRTAQQIERKSLRGLLSNAGEMFEFVDQSLDRGSKIRHE